MKHLKIAVDDDILVEDLIAALRKLPPGTVMALQDGRNHCFQFGLEVEERQVGDKIVTISTFVS